MKLSIHVLVCALLSIAALTTSACIATDTIYKDEGDLCIGNEGSALSGRTSTVSANEPLRVVVAFGCGSSSCDKLEKANCTVTVDGDRIIIDSFARVAPVDLITTGCTSDCNIFSAQCTIPPLDEGEYTIVHGDETRTLTVPGDTFECNGDAELAF